MLPLIAGTIPDFGRGLAGTSAARSYSATRGNTEAAPIGQVEASMPVSGRRQGDRRSPSRRKPRSADHLGQQVDMEV